MCITMLFCNLPLLTTSCSFYRSAFSPYLDREISGPLIVDAEWKEIMPTESLKSERDINAVMFDFATPQEHDNVKGLGLRFPDGKVITPEVQLVDENGKLYDLSVGFLGTKGIGFVLRDSNSNVMILPKDRAYRAVRVRCERPISFSRVYWHSYNQSDMK